MIAKAFPTINGKVPYEAPVTTPYLEVFTTDTPYSVKSHGFKSSWYTWATFYNEPTFDAAHIRYQSYLPFMRFYSGKYWPTEISQEYNNYRQFGLISYSCFHPDATSATINLMGNGKGYIQVVGKGTFPFTKLGINKEDKKSLHVTGLTIGGHYLVLIGYSSNDRKQSEDNVFVATWESSGHQGPMVLSAGYFTDYGLAGDYVSSYKLSNILSSDLDIGNEQSSKFTFLVPLATQGSSVGYKYVPSGDYFVDVTNANKKIQRFRMIEYNTGYKYDSGISTVKKFSGQIRNWDVNRTSSGSDVIEVTCYDWSSFLTDSLNTGYPNVSDYLAFDYLDDVKGGVSGRTKPRTYDGWKLIDVVDSLLLNAYVDPYISNQKRKYVNVEDNVVTDNYLVFDKDNNNQIFLDRQFYYGRPMAVDVDVDDSYLWQFSIGESISDNLQKVCDNYGFKYGFNNDGNFYINSVKNPIKTKSIDEMTFASLWSENINIYNLYGVSKTTASSGKAVATFIGSEVKAIFELGSFGTVRLKLSNPTIGQVFLGDLSLRKITPWRYNDGIDDSLGYNPCIIQIGEELSYGSYSLNISSVSSTVNINSILIYDRNNDAVATFYTGSTSTVMSVILDNLKISSNADNVRNDVTVVGKLKGVKSSLAVTEGQVINPNNPVEDHVISRTVDRISLGSVSNSYYTGRPLQMMIIDNKIATEDRASWLSYETIDRYNKSYKSLQPQISIVGNPLLELGDYVKIKDLKTNALVTMHDFWVTGINEKHEDKGLYTTDLQLESFKPWESFYKYPVPSLKRFGNKIFLNVEHYNTGLCPKNLFGYETKIGSLLITETYAFIVRHIDKSKVYIDADIDIVALASFQKEMENKVPRQGYLKVKRELIRYNDRTITCGKPVYRSPVFPNMDYRTQAKIGFYLGDLTREMYNTPLYHNMSINDPVDLSISPYSSEEFNICPAIKFDLLVPGFVQVSVKDSSHQVMEYLTGNDARNKINSWVYLDAGTHYFSWGMLDRIGNHNEANSGKAKKAGTGEDVPNANIVNFEPGSWEQFEEDYPDYINNNDTYIISGDYYVQNKIWDTYESSYFNVSFMDNRNVYVNNIHTLETKVPIFTSLRHSGSYALSTDPGYGVEEEFNINIRETGYSDFTGDLSTLWYNHSWRGYNRGYVYPGIRNDERITTQKTPWTQRIYYTGMENNGAGFKIHLSNKQDNSRIVNIKILRKVFIFSQFVAKMVHNTYGSYTEFPFSFSPFLRDCEEEELTLGKSYTLTVDGLNGADLYISVPNFDFIPTEFYAKFHELKTERVEALDNVKTGQGFRIIPKYILYLAAVSHLHCFTIIATDMSGKKSVSRKSVYWVPKDMLNTREMFDSCTPGLFDKVIKSGLDNLPYQMCNFFPINWPDGGRGHRHDLNSLKGVHYWPIVKEYNSKQLGKSVIYMIDIMGVQVYGGGQVQNIKY